MNTVLYGAVMLVVVLIGMPGYAAEHLVLYDDFNARSINPDRWWGGEFSPAPPPRWGAEAIRQLQDNRLRLMYRSFGPKTSNSGMIRNEFVLLFRHPELVTAIQAAVTVTDADTTDCPGNAESTVARAALSGRFFGGRGGTPEGDVKDMVAFIGIIQVSGFTPLRAQSFVYSCANQPCTTGMTLHRQDLGAVKRGEPTRLRVQWDRVQEQFIFQRDEQPEVFAKYAVSDIVPPSIPAKLLTVMQFVPDCTAATRPMAYMDALFDDVMVNESAAPAGER
jgi:hypothetical protein